jgi:aquaporin Z
VSFVFDTVQTMDSGGVPTPGATRANPGRLDELARSTERTAFGSAPRWAADFGDLRYEWRRVCAEIIGTFFLVVVACGAVVVDTVSSGAVGRGAAVVAPALMVMALILATGAVSGAHLNPAVTVAFALRREFPWGRVPLYLLGQVIGGVLACLLLRAVFGNIGHLGATYPGAHATGLEAMWIEALLTCGLTTTILGTASGAQNVGTLSALAVAGYIALAGLWASPISGASMNPVRSFAPDLVSGDFSYFWVYLVGPTIGLLAAIGIALVLRGRGGDVTAAKAAQGSLAEPVIRHGRWRLHDKRFLDSDR